MSFKPLLYYWLAVAASGAVGFWVPVAGWAFAVGAFVYLLCAIPGWLLTSVFFANMEHRATTFGMPNARFVRLLALVSLGACALGLWSGLDWLAYGGALFVYVSGEGAVTDRMLARRAAQAG